MGNRLFVGNLPYSATDAELRELFTEHGSVTDLHIATDRETGRPRGFAFVSLSTEAEAQAAAQALNGHSFGGRPLVVNIARGRGEGPPPRTSGGPPRSDRPPRPAGDRPGSGPPSRPAKPAFRGPPPQPAPAFEEPERPVRTRSKRKPNYEKDRGSGRPRPRGDEGGGSKGKGGNWRQWLDDDDD